MTNHIDGLASKSELNIITRCIESTFALTQSVAGLQNNCMTWLSIAIKQFFLFCVVFIYFKSVDRSMCA